jgi:hypothetical protein
MPRAACLHRARTTRTSSCGTSPPKPASSGATCRPTPPATTHTYTRHTHTHWQVHNAARVILPRTRTRTRKAGRRVSFSSSRPRSHLTCSLSLSLCVCVCVCICVVCVACCVGSVSAGTRATSPGCASCGTATPWCRRPRTCSSRCGTSTRSTAYRRWSDTAPRCVPRERASSPPLPVAGMTAST